MSRDVIKMHLTLPFLIDDRVLISFIQMYFWSIEKW